MSMTFGQILDVVCKDGIDQSYRQDAQQWVINRHEEVWGAADWTFKYETGAITFTNGAQVIASGDSPSDMHAVYAIYDSYGAPLRGFRDVRQFFDRYNTNALPASSIAPEAYTTIAGQILVGPVGNGSGGLIVYQKTKPSLVNDSDPTGLPDGFDLALALGAKATGYLLTNNPLAGPLEAEYQAKITAMENDWLDQTLETGEQSGAYRPGPSGPWW